MFMKLKAATFAAAIGLGSFGAMMAPASVSAATLPLNLAPITTDSAGQALQIEKVAERRPRRARRHRPYRSYRPARRHYSYDRHRHGSRYRYRTHRHRHYYNGYWYAIPFWLGAAAIVNSYNQPYYSQPYYAPAPAPRYRHRAGSRHVRWCLNRYRSYNPRTDQYLAYSGVYRYCNSPYRR